MRVATIAAGVLLLSLALGSAVTSAATPTTPTQPPAVDTAGPGPDGSSGAAAAPVDPLAPPTYQQVARNGRRPHPAVLAGPGRVAAVAPAKYPDAVALSITKTTQGTEQAEGPGSFRGRHYTAFTLSLTNGSPQPIDLTQVVVTTTYGAPPRIASPVYEDAAAADFTGTVAPGATATATYEFAIPLGQARSATMTVDFDEAHAPATFTGLS